MSMIDEELTRLGLRLKDLKLRVIPNFESKTQMLFSRIQTMQNANQATDRQKLEHEYTLLSKELRKRCDEQIRIRQEMERLELQKRFSR